MDQQLHARVADKAKAAIEYLAEVDLAAAASVLRVGRIEITDSEEVPTACIKKERDFSGSRFKIVLNAAFCDRGQNDVTCILLHELLHHVMRHLEGEPIGPDRHLCNVVEDAFINHAIHLLNPQLAAFFEDFYPADKMPHLMLRSNSRPIHEEDRVLYHAHQNGQLTEHDLYRALQQGGHEKQPIQLIGSHDQEDGASALPDAGVEKILGELKEQLASRGRQGEKQAGRIGERSEEFMRMRNAKKLAPVEDALKQAINRNLRAELLDKVVRGEGIPRSRSPLMPERPARQDLYWMLAGLDPVMWSIPEDHNPRGAVAIYLDVSGSMSKEARFVYECCLAFKEMLHTEIFLFSEYVHPVSLEELQAGKIDTSYGTSFDCVLDDLLARQYIRKAVLFTDGHAQVSQSLVEQMTQGGQELIAVLTSGGQERVITDFCSDIYHLPPAS